jgi:hypothetical protein
MDPDDWQVPDLNIAYSKGAPMGRTISGKEVYNRVMLNTMGCEVACSESHSTCTSALNINTARYHGLVGQGVKVCPHGDLDSLSEPHTSASREDVRKRLDHDRNNQLQYTSPSKVIFS